MADISKDFALRAVARVLLELAVCAEGGVNVPDGVLAVSEA